MDEPFKPEGANLEEHLIQHINRLYGQTENLSIPPLALRPLRKAIIRVLDEDRLGTKADPQILNLIKQINNTFAFHEFKFERILKTNQIRFDPKTLTQVKPVQLRRSNKDGNYIKNLIDAKTCLNDYFFQAYQLEKSDMMRQIAIILSGIEKTLDKLELFYFPGSQKQLSSLRKANKLRRFFINKPSKYGIKTLF